MNTRFIVGVICVLGLSLVAGCQSPIEKTLGRHPNWQRKSQRMISECRENASGLERVPFPDLSNPVHRKVWEALYKRDKIGEGFGTICDFFGFYLVNLHDENVANASYFYEPTNGLVISGDDGTSGVLYGGDKTASVTNIVKFVRYITDVSGYRTFLITDAEQIPHSRYPFLYAEQSITDFLVSRGVSIGPPTLLKRKLLDGEEFVECSVFVYEPCGGDVFRYDVQCRDGKIIGFDKYKVISGVGDFWVFM